MWTSEKPANPGFYFLTMPGCQQMWAVEITAIDGRLYEVLNSILNPASARKMFPLDSNFYEGVMWWNERITVPKLPE